jgi:phage tail sheath protein FI
MPTAPTYPGVYIEEVPSGVRTITGVATSIAAFIDFFREGPMNKAVQIFGMADFEREFGGLDTRSEASYAIAQLFLNGGSEAWVIRTAHDGGGADAVATATVRIKKALAPAAGEVMLVSAVSEGLWGNTVRVTVTPSALGVDRFDLTAVRYASTDPTAAAIKSEKYLGLSLTPTSSKYFVDVLNDQSKLIRVQDLRNAASIAAGDMPAPNGSFSKADIALTGAQINALNGKKIGVKIGPAAAVVATITYAAGATVDDLRKLRGPLEDAIHTAAADNEAYAGATVELIGSRYLIKSGRSDAYLPTDVVDITNSGADTTADDLQLTGTGNVQEYGLGPDPANSAPSTNIKGMKVGVKGLDGQQPEATDIIGSDALKTGIYALRDVDLFNILCVPRAAEIGKSNPTQMDQIIAKALAFCKERRAFLIVDIPPTINEVQEMKDFLEVHDGFRDRNTAIYFPRLKIPDPLDEYRLRSVGASGTMAGLYARTDSARGVWKAPAGTEATLAGVVELDTKLTDAQNGTLNPLAINCARNFPVYGNVCWGARTLDGADQVGSEWKYIPIRRLALFLEESLFRGTKWVVFEPNDEPLWAKVRLNVGAFMMSLFRQGAFQGSTPDKAFYVKCDAETTTQDDRNKGIINIEVGFAPLKPAEFVIIKIQQIAGDLD